jgi:hypothetical protein
MAKVSGSKRKPKKKRSDAAQAEKNAMELAAAGQLPAGRRAAAKKAKKLPGSIIALEEMEVAEPQPDCWVEEDDDSMLASVLAKQPVRKKAKKKAKGGKTRKVKVHSHIFEPCGPKGESVAVGDNATHVKCLLHYKGLKYDSGRPHEEVLPADISNMRRHAMNKIHKECFAAIEKTLNEVEDDAACESEIQKLISKACNPRRLTETGFFQRGVRRQASRVTASFYCLYGSSMVSFRSIRRTARTIWLTSSISPTAPS